MKRIVFKPGGDFLLTCTYKVAGEATGIPPGTVFKSQIRTARRELVADLDYGSSADPAVFTFSKAAAQTKSWPAGCLLYADVRKVDSNGLVTYSVTYAIDSQVRQTDE